LHRDVATDDKQQLEALIHMYEKGANYIDVSLKYADGYTLLLIKKFLDEVGRKNIFINAKLEQYIENPEDVSTQLAEYLKGMRTDYVDTLQLHAPSFTKLPLAQTYHEMNRLIIAGQVRFLGGSNFSITHLKQAAEGSGRKMFSLETIFNFEIRINQDAGVLDYCNENEILFVAYQPLRRNNTARKEFPLLIKLSDKYRKSQTQIILNWLVRKGVMPLIRSDSFNHIDEDFEALSFELSEVDYELIEDFRNPEVNKIDIDWEDSGKGVSLYQLPNILS